MTAYTARRSHASWCDDATPCHPSPDWGAGIRRTNGLSPRTAGRAADPTAYAQLAAEIRAQLDTKRHADAERHSEARAGGAVCRLTADDSRQMPPSGLAFWTRIYREDRHADYAGQPATMRSAYTPEP